MQKAIAIFSLLAASFFANAGTLTKSHSQGKYSDEEIEATIKSKLAKSKIGKDGIQVHVKNFRYLDRLHHCNAAQRRCHPHGQDRRRHAGCQQHQTF
jgi:hypothetical protein